MKKTFKMTFKITSIIGLVIIFDQLTKGILLYMLTKQVPLIGKAWDLVPVPFIITRVTDFFNIVFTWNPGFSFSMLRSLGEALPIILIALSSIVIGLLIHHMVYRAEVYEKLPLALVVGGAFGNLIDRIRFGAVIDFLDFHIGALHWPSFNLADICIVVGVGLYILVWVLKRNKK